MKTLKHGVVVFCIFLLIFGFLGCSNASQSEVATSSGTGEIKSASITGIKTIYMSKIPVAQTSRSARSVGTDIETLSYIQNGRSKKIERVSFTKTDVKSTSIIKKRKDL